MWLVAIAVATPQRRRLTLGGIALITAVWTADALAQAAFGSSALFWSLDQLKQLVSGHGLCNAAEVAAVDRLSGVLGPCNLKFGQVLASLSPFLLFAAARRGGLWGWGVAAAAVGVVLVLAGSRAAWLTYALVVAYSGWRLLGARALIGCLAIGWWPRWRSDSVPARCVSAWRAPRWRGRATATATASTRRCPGARRSGLRPAA